MHGLVKTAAAIHQLSLAAAYGGAVFATTALRTAAKEEIRDTEQRIRFMTSVWSKYNSKVNVPAHVLFTATWLVERRAILNLKVDRNTTRLVHLKDLLIAGALLTGVANVLVGKELKRELRHEAKTEGTAGEKAVISKYGRFFKVMGPLNMALIAGSIAIGPAIGAGIVRSERRSFLGRLFHR